MPRRRRVAKQRRGVTELSLEQFLNLLTGHWHEFFSSDEERREAWEWHRESLLARDDPGSRPSAWWDYDSSEPRNEEELEAAQLVRMGEIGEEELERAKKTWRLYEGQARGIASLHTDDLSSWAREYLEHRHYHGIPDWYDSGELTAAQKKAVKRAAEVAFS